MVLDETSTPSLKRPNHENNIQNRKEQVYQTFVSVKKEANAIYRDVNEAKITKL